MRGPVSMSSTVGRLCDIASRRSLTLTGIYQESTSDRFPNRRLPHNLALQFASSLTNGANTDTTPVLQSEPDKHLIDDKPY